MRLVYEVHDRRVELLKQGEFVCLTGIDGSGKTTTAAKVVAQLQRLGMSAALIDKKQTDYPSPYLTTFMSTFKSLLWDYRESDPVREIPDAGWLHMHTLWYTIMAEHRILPLLQTHRFVLTDSWFHKILARFLLNPHFDHAQASMMFSRLPPGDAIFFLDVSPETCWHRRHQYKESEMGSFANYTGDAHARYVQYQSDVRQRLLELATAYPNWHVLPVEGMAIDEVCDMIVDRLLHMYS